MKIRAYRHREISEPVGRPLSTLGYRDFTGNSDWKHNLVSFTSLLYLPGRHKVLCGLTAFDTDLLYEFDPDTGAFRGLGYPGVSEKFEIKIHRSLCPMRDGRVMGATACLHREDQRLEGRGGRIFILQPETGEIEFLGIPVPLDYIQTITLDEGRGLVYGFTYPVFNFFVFDINSRRTRRVDYMGSIPHISALDDEGRYWATWNCRTHNLFSYDPDADSIKYYQHNLPMTGESCGLMYPGAGPIDAAVKGPDGLLYIGEAYGNLDRLDPRTGRAENLGRPTGFTRMAALEFGPGGKLYGIAGFLGHCHLFSYAPEEGVFEDFGRIEDSETGMPLFIGHDICFAPGNRVFVGETDTSDRAGYLWECRLK